MISTAPCESNLALPWTDADADGDSLAVALSAVLARGGTPATPAELTLDLGLPWLATAGPGEPLTTWRFFARDAFLLDVAEQYGLRLRDLHPPAAAVGLARSAEFPQHFADSYVPLIERALQHNQVVLAWRGWPAPRELQWGVITGRRADGLFGYVNGLGGQPARLPGPALQVYVVEEQRGVPALPVAERLRRVAARIVRGWSGEFADRFGVRCGPGAYEAWRSALRQPPQHDRNEPSLRVQHAALVRHIRAVRAGAAAWLNDHAPQSAAFVQITRRWVAAAHAWCEREAAADDALSAGARLVELEAIDAACVDALRGLTRAEADGG